MTIHRTPNGTKRVAPVTESLTSFQMFIDGQWTDAARRDVFESDNPYTGKPWALFLAARPTTRTGACGPPTAR